MIIGTGGNALDVLDTLEALNAEGAGWEIAGFLDDSTEKAPLGFPVLGRLEDATRLAARDSALADIAFVNTIGSERNHARRAEILAHTGLRAEQFATLVHPRAAVSPRAVLGHGCYIGFGSSVGGYVSVADNVWVGPGCVIGHDSVLGHAAIMAPRATISGFVRLGACCYVGSAAVIRQRVHVGEQALVGLGAVVLSDVAPRTIVVGNPARVLVRASARAGHGGPLPNEGHLP